MTFSANVTGTGGGNGGFTMTASGGACTLTVTGTAGATVSFNISRTIVGGETITLSYTPGTVVAASGGAAVQAFSNFPVTNGQGGGVG